MNLQLTLTVFGYSEGESTSASSYNPESALNSANRCKDSSENGPSPAYLVHSNAQTRNRLFSRSFDQ